MCKACIKHLKYVKTNKNLGYGKACNLGVTYCSTPFIIFLNPDILIDPISMDELIKYGPDYIVLASPTSNHYEQLYFLETYLSNKKILVEKPLTINSKKKGK